MPNSIIYGTYPLRGPALAPAVASALSAGYRAFDTAQMYGNEADLGPALGASGVDRASLRVTTKIAPLNHAPQRFLPSLRQSLADLGLDYVDLLLLHFPPAPSEMEAALTLLAGARATGLARAVGVSNFTPALMRQAAGLKIADLAFNQVEFHPLLDGQALLAASAETGVPLQAYSPLARGAALKPRVLHEIAARYGRTPAQIVLSWILRQGVSVVVQSANPMNIAANRAALDITLSDKDMEGIAVLAAANHRIISRREIAWAPSWD